MSDAAAVARSDDGFARVRHGLQSGGKVADDEFDAVYPLGVRRVSGRFWTPVDMAVRIAKLLVVNRATRVLDVGSGVGKFCVVGALATGASFTGIEHRAHLVSLARDCAKQMRARRTKFLHGRFQEISWAEFDAIYFYNPFGENVFSSKDHLDSSVELSRARGLFDVQLSRRLLAAAKVGTRVATFHGFGGAMPRTYKRVRKEENFDCLEVWEKVSNRTREVVP